MSVPRPSVLALLVGVVAALFVGLLAYGLIAQAPGRGIDGPLGEGRAAVAPAFELPVLHRGEPGPLADRLRRPLSDGRLSLDELKGSPVVVNFWASWCVPCRAEAPVLERGWRQARRDGVVFLGLNMQDAPSDARRFVREFSVSYPNVRDEDDGVAREWGTTGLPETFFVSADGEVVSHVIGLIRPAQLQAGLRAARSGQPTAAAVGGDRRTTR